MKEIEIYITSISKKFDFSLDENTPLDILADEVSSMVGQKEQFEMHGELASLLFYSKNKKMILDGSKSLKQLGIHSGDVISLI